MLVAWGPENAWALEKMAAKGKGLFVNLEAARSSVLDIAA
jgi:hypothetical protein